MPFGFNLCSGRPSSPAGGVVCFSLKSHSIYYNSREKTWGEVGVWRICQNTGGVTGPPGITLCLPRAAWTRQCEGSAFPPCAWALAQSPVRSALAEVGQCRPVLSCGCNFVFAASAFLAAISGWRTEATSAPARDLWVPLLAILAP